jgi:hypothetical protein
MQLAKARTNVALDAAVIEPMPVARGKLRTSGFLTHG